jgi:hypothetical protein
MELVVEPAPDPGVAEAARLAAARAGVGELSPLVTGRGRWWRAGVDDATEHPPGLRRVAADYVAAPSRRSTRGATRA